MTFALSIISGLFITMSDWVNNMSDMERKEGRSELTEKFKGNINKGVPNHECGLPLCEHVIIRYINSGVLVELRRKLKLLTMVSDMDQNSKALFKSTAQIKREEQKHLENDYFMIHPFSKARFWWEMLMLIVYLAQLLMIPIEISTMNTGLWIVFPNLFLDLISCVDITLFFCTGYHDKTQQKVIMRPKKVATHYLKTYFLVDFMSSIPISFVLHVKKDWAYLWPLKLLMIFKLGRIPKMITYLEKFCERKNIWSYNLRVIESLICFVIFIIWATAIENLLKETSGKRDKSTSYLDQMLESCFLITMRFMLIGLISTAKDNQERIIQAVSLFLGSILNMIILGQIIQIYNRHSSSRNKYNNLMQQISEYMKYKELPYRLREKVFRYVNFKFQKHVFKEEDVFNTLSSRLREEISLHNCQRLVEKVDFFKNAPVALILRLVTKMKSEIFLPNDIIVHAGIAGNAMYFIYLGTVAVYAKNGKEICHLHDGSHFGEISLVINEPRVATVIAIKDCEVFRLSRRDYQEAISPFPEFANQIRRSALGRLESMIKMMNKEAEKTTPINKDTEKTTPQNR